ncbi:FtsX-like permease family protein [Candidatus Entotheonella palauensis]|uniref:FtsX-like permease family protein n=1 Tax=Candidatus Entotheonella palauensis TaxID=93172 RepID=UPI0015C4AF9E|nr:FtsX-like permease family protein [Candidatus Entotheonella palauensis]
MKRIGLIAGLSLRDFLHEWRMSICAVLGVAAALAPLLVFFGLKFGIVSALTQRLRQDPRNLELRIVGQGFYTETWLTTLQARAEAAFVVPKTRFLAATVRLRHEQHPDRPSTNVDLIPTGSDDPLLQGQSDVPQGFEEIVLSASAAEHLRVSPGTQLQGVIGRVVNGEKQRELLKLNVIAVLPASYDQRSAAFVALPLLLAFEQYREGIAVPELNWSGRPAPEGPRTYASFRLYARSLADVASLRDWLAQQDITSHTQAVRIETVQRLDRNLTTLFLILAVLSGSGVMLTLVVSQWAAVIRKQRHLSVLCLLGFKTVDIALFPVVQAATAALSGTLLATGLYYVLEPLTNRLFVERLQLGEQITRLLPRHVAMALGLTLIFAVIAASVAAWRAANLSPSDGLRDE